MDASLHEASHELHSALIPRSSDRLRMPKDPDHSNSIPASRVMGLPVPSHYYGILLIYPVDAMSACLESYLRRLASTRAINRYCVLLLVGFQLSFCLIIIIHPY